MSILDSSVEDILWVEVKDKFTLKVLNICVCYLPPEGSSRHVDPHAFFANLLSQIYIYQDIGPYMICGDFNARCSNEPDYIEGVDDIVERHVVDYKKNSYGDLFIEFLINSSCVMLNGRCGTNSEFTSRSTIKRSCNGRLCYCESGESTSMS